MDKLPIEYKEFWERWNDFEGKSSVRDFWLTWAINFGISLLLSLVGWILGFTLLGSLFGLAVFIPSIAILIRRLHDTGRSGWYWLWVFLPFVGWIILLIALIQESK